MRRQTLESDGASVTAIASEITAHEPAKLASINLREATAVVQEPGTVALIRILRHC